MGAAPSSVRAGVLFSALRVGTCKPDSPFWISSGSCQLDGRCVTSPLYPQAYPWNEDCEVGVERRDEGAREALEGALLLGPRLELGQCGARENCR